MTKIREYGQAEIYLRYAIERSVALDSGVQYSYAHEKRGILLAKQGNFEDARNEILKARTEIKSTHALRKVQSAIAEAQGYAQEYSGIIGNHFFSHFIIAFDFEKKKNLYQSKFRQSESK